MNSSSQDNRHPTASGPDDLAARLGIVPDTADERPILVVPYMWIGDFVRGHTAVRVLKARWPNRPVDLLTTTLCAPLVDYMPGVRKGIVADLPRGTLAIDANKALAARLGPEHYGTAIMLLRTWKSALAPTLAGIPERVGFFGELRYGLLTDTRFGEKALPRMVDRCAMLALPKGAARPAEEWPMPQIVVPDEAVARWRADNAIAPGPAVALAPGSVGPAKRWTDYAGAARRLTEQGLQVWVVGGPGERDLARSIVAEAGARDLTGTDLRNGIVALAAADVAVSNDSGLLHVAAAIGTPTIGIFGPTSAYHWAPLNPVAALIETETDVACRPCHRPVCREQHHRCMRDIPAARVAAAVLTALGSQPDA